MSALRRRPGSAPVREWVGLAVLLGLGCGLRLAFVAAYPTLPFWDFVALIHFASSLKQHGMAAHGWYWAQFSPGLPMVLSVLFRVFPADPIATARIATAAVTGLLPALPFVLWRPVLAFRWRILAGLLLALWPGQVLFSGVVAQDNWVLLPTIALACLAVRARLGDGPTTPLIGGLLYAGATAIRQEMALALLPLVWCASVPETPPARRRDIRRLAIVVLASFVLLGTQRYLATGRFTLTTEHGALGLFGSFMPGASTPGWIDGRAYATSREPDAPKLLFGNPRVLLRLTREEVKRRPAFHAIRVATWIPRLAVDSDSDNLVWSLGAPQAQAVDRQPPAQLLARSWTDLLKWELAAIQGAFLVTIAVGWARRDRAILALGSAVALKFATHALISPLGRLVVPAIALELLAIPLGTRELVRSSGRIRLLGAAAAAAGGLLLLVGVPRLTNFVVARDSPVLLGVRRFDLVIEKSGPARCELLAGVVTGLGPKWASLRTTSESPEAGDAARVVCSIPLPESGDSIALEIHDPSFALPNGRLLERVTVDGVEALRRPMGPGSASVTIDLTNRASRGRPTASVEIVLEARDGPGESGGRNASLRFDFVRRPRTSGSGATP